MILFDLIPTPYRLLGAAVGVVAVTVAVWISGSRHGLAEGRAERDAVTSRWNAERAAQAGAAASASEAARFEETRRATAAQEIARDAKAKIDAAHAAAVRATVAAERLRQHTSELAAACDRPAGDSSAAGPGAPASGAGSVLADMLGRMEAAGRELAATADERGAAGLACERWADSLMRK